jgi:hypothetical protein
MERNQRVPMDRMPWDVSSLFGGPGMRIKAEPTTWTWATTTSERLRGETGAVLSVAPVLAVGVKRPDRYGL